MGKLGPAGLIAGAGLAAVGVGITALVLPVANTADELANLAQKTGISVEALSALTYVAQMSDTDLQGLVKGLIIIAAVLLAFTIVTFGIGILITWPLYVLFLLWLGYRLVKGMMRLNDDQAY